MKYCSLGIGCHSSQILKRIKLKEESYPFDWINSSTEVVRDCIKDNFSKFLDKSYYSPAENPWDDDRVCHHDFYKQFLIHDSDAAKQIFFRHTDPSTNEHDYSYYERCIDRFRNLLASEEHKVFLLILPNRGDDITNSITDVLSLSKFLEEYTTNFTIITVHQQVKGHQSFNLINGSNLKFIHLTTNSLDFGGHYDDFDDELYLDNIIKQLINDIGQSKEIR
jgi:hypothetical protein